MPFTVVYTEAPRCAYCGKPMRTWIMFAEVHMHEHCQKLYFRDRMQEVFDKLREEWGLQKRAPPEFDQVIEDHFWELC